MTKYEEKWVCNKCELKCNIKISSDFVSVDLLKRIKTCLNSDNKTADWKKIKEKIKK